MSEPITERISRKTGVPGLVRLLAEQLSGTELSSLLLEVFHERVGRMTPQGLLQQYQANRFVQPSELDMIGVLEMELKALQYLKCRKFQPLELSPAAQWGSCSVVATASQKKIISAIRNTEIMADATNALALHIAGIRKNDRRRAAPEGSGGTAAPGEDAAVTGGGFMRYCTVHRHIRTQEIKGSGFTPHFKVGCLVTAGRDTGNYEFECMALAEQIQTLYHLFREVFLVEKVRFKLQRRAGYEDGNPLIERLYAYLEKGSGEIGVSPEEPAVENGYYKGVQYKMVIEVGGREWEIADGGFVDWTRQLLGDGKERLLIGGWGLDFLYRLQHDLLS
jgi:hypothetical protein